MVWWFSDWHKVEFANRVLIVLGILAVLVAMAFGVGTIVVTIATPETRRWLHLKDQESGSVPANEQPPVEGKNPGDGHEDRSRAMSPLSEQRSASSGAVPEPLRQSPPQQSYGYPISGGQGYVKVDYQGLASLTDEASLDYYLRNFLQIKAITAGTTIAETVRLTAEKSTTATVPGCGSGVTVTVHYFFENVAGANQPQQPDTQTVVGQKCIGNDENQADKEAVGDALSKLGAALRSANYTKESR